MKTIFLLFLLMASGPVSTAVADYAALTIPASPQSTPILATNEVSDHSHDAERAALAEGGRDGGHRYGPGGWLTD